MTSATNQQFFAQDEGARKFTGLDVVMALVGTIVAALILACVYAPAIYYSPIVYLTILLTYGLGWVLGRCASGMLRRFRIDSPRVALFLGLIGGVVAVWASWMAYLVVITDFNFGILAIAANPTELLQIIQFIAHNPVWTFSKVSTPGPALMYYAFWVGEFVLIVYLTVKMCLAFIASNKLCGQCGNWVRPTGETALFALPEDPEEVTRLMAGDLSILPTLPRLAKDDESAAMRWLAAHCFACGACEDQNAKVTVTLMAIQLDKNDKPQTTATIIANLADVSPELEQAIFEPAPEPKAATTETVETDETAKTVETEETEEAEEAGETGEDETGDSDKAPETEKPA